MVGLVGGGSVINGAYPVKFIKMYGIKGKLCKVSFTYMASLFEFFYAIFCRHLQWISKKVSSQINSGNAQFATKSCQINIQGKSFSKDVWYQRTILKVECYGNGEYIRIL